MIMSGGGSRLRSPMFRKMEATMAFFLCLLILGFAASKLNGADNAGSVRGGLITGFVKLQGPVPQLAPPEILKAKDVCKHVPNETLVVGPDRGIRYAVITLEGVVPSEVADTEATHELDNAGCRFVPHVQAMMVNQFLLLKNTDPILHTDHAFFQGAQPQFNVGLYPGKVMRKPMVSVGLVKVLCEVHPWMKAYVVVTDNPYHAVTDIYGEYRISDVPPGNYRLKAWQELLGTQKQKVEVKSGATSKVDFVFAAAKGGDR